MSRTKPIRSSRLINATPFFYGWVVLMAATLGIVMLGPSQTFTVSLFIDAFVQELDISRATISLLYGVATLGAAFLLPITGHLVDRYGPRTMMVLATLALGLACIFTSRVQGMATLLAGLLAMRFFGFGSMQLVSNNAIAQWFIRRRGFVMGLAGQSLAISLLIFPLLGEALIKRFSWRGAWVALGLLVWVMIPLSWLLFRDSPERYGRLPDGDRPLPEPTDPQLLAAAPRGIVSERSWTLAEARRTGVFWIFAVGLSCMTMALAGLVFHQASLFAERGLSREIAVRSFQVVALFSVVGNLTMGRLLDHFSARRLLALALLLLGAMLVLVQVMSTPAQAMLYAALQGLVSGSYRVMDATVWPKYYGRAHLGSIRGATMIGTLGATALGPYPLGLSLDSWGSYGPALTLLLGLATAMGLVTLCVQRPQSKPLQ